MYKGQKITVIIPCLNEEQGIERFFGACRKFVDEVIVVDNGSTDRMPDCDRSTPMKIEHRHRVTESSCQACA